MALPFPEFIILELPEIVTLPPLDIVAQPTDPSGRELDLFSIIPPGYI